MIYCTVAYHMGITDNLIWIHFDSGMSNLLQAIYHNLLHYIFYYSKYWNAKYSNSASQLRNLIVLCYVYALISYCL